MPNGDITATREWVIGHKKEYEFLCADVASNAEAIKTIKEGMQDLRDLQREVKILRSVMLASIFAIAINIVVAIIA